MKQGRTPKDQEKAKQLGKQIKIQRITHDWTQEELGKHSGLSRKMISNFERGINIPNAFQMFAIEKAFCPTGECKRLVCSVMESCFEKQQ